MNAEQLEYHMLIKNKYFIKVNENNAKRLGFSNVYQLSKAVQILIQQDFLKRRNRNVYQRL